MNGKLIRVWVVMLCALMALTPFAVAEEDASAKELGINLASFWPFAGEEDDMSVCPIGIDTFSFVFYAPEVKPGEGVLEIRNMMNDEVVYTMDVQEMKFEYLVGDVLGDGQETAYTKVSTAKRVPLDVSGLLYLYVPAGAFVAGDVKSPEYGSTESLSMLVLNCGFAGNENFTNELTVGESTQMHLILGSANSIEILCEGAISVDQTKFTADGVLTITASEVGEGKVTFIFSDAAGLGLTASEQEFLCK